MKTIIILLLIPFGLFSQQDSANKNSLLLGINFTSNYSYRFLTVTEHLKYIKQIRDDIERARFRPAIGFNALKSITRRIDLELGLLYSDKGYDDFSSNVINANTLDTGSLNSSYHYGYLEIPLKVIYKVSTGKRKIYLSLGISPSIDLNYKYYYTYIESNGHQIMGSYSRTIEESHHNKVNLVLFSGIGTNFNLGKKWIFKIEPSFSCSLSSIYVNNDELSEYLYSIGINTGIYLKL